MKAILIRIGIDTAYGGWNAPVDLESGRFVYVPIPESAKSFHPNCARTYSEVKGPLSRFIRDCRREHLSHRYPIDGLQNCPMHLDPDFEYLTYGDDGSRRGSQIKLLRSGDLLVFYASLRPLIDGNDPLIYAIVGLIVVREVVNVADVPSKHWHENAHTRKVQRGQNDIIVRGRAGVSGRCVRCVPIGEFRNKAYRVRVDLLRAWGGLSVKDGYIQRSGRPPMFRDASRFYNWWQRQKVRLVRENFLGQNSSRSVSSRKGAVARLIVQEEADNTSDSELSRRGKWRVTTSARMKTSPVILIHLRRPNQSAPDESRSDPFFEFGSFGCTGCHCKNLMNPKRAHELAGARVGFAQGGDSGFRLVHLTPPVEVVRYANCCELVWRPAEMPFRYENAPLLVNDEGASDFPALLQLIERVRRPTWLAKFSSAFRSRREPLDVKIGREVCRIFDRLRSKARQAGIGIARVYTDALPYKPNYPDTHRKSTLGKLRASLKGRRLTDSVAKVRGPECRGTPNEKKC